LLDGYLKQRFSRVMADPFDDFPVEQEKETKETNIILLKQQNVDISPEAPLFLDAHILHGEIYMMMKSPGFTRLIG
jgi:hypothetical protein